ncbi:conserved Plasmodium protein, unknown function [Plasmodium knowlesi strain H]|uniref:Uncharacterized protein n=3 Tax=Plasmodium knowlesi TaxID=5850 RepID=A0A1A7VLW0_PLAKH|nr:conserved Plasmodium protein, unknown function [Plasmodium knowlesi strain H]OTN65311.1 Uncharacterized protein PKNOH_S110108700 [Plasmodium knowlesi]CAA9989704.1 conserved Plasmodium protein, unknown function [Plasmodium knowlesi strain H]SBO22858.1 conserved Plasmodium protein, unknown function [Plasmodium knowlesi strain H]SBO23043.1 conserved Plasmodium protein, unknown function [Plasmodium knowlesi strain H]VVS79178.1 conserved Plasmodium protein, unknown function [Plasmodium knowlesi 
MTEKDAEPKGLSTKLGELTKTLRDVTAQRDIPTEEKANLEKALYLKLYEEKKGSITEFLNKEKKKVYDQMENFKNDVLQKINIINEKNEDVKKQADILTTERNKNLCFIKNLETKLENIKKVIM